METKLRPIETLSRDRYNSCSFDLFWRFS